MFQIEEQNIFLMFEKSKTLVIRILPHIECNIYDLCWEVSVIFFEQNVALNPDPDFVCLLASE